MQYVDQTEPLHIAAATMEPAEAVLSWLRTDADLGYTRRWDEAAWRRAQHATLVYGIAPLLAERLDGTAAWAQLAPSLQAYMREQRRLNSERIALMQADLAALLTVAADEGVDLMPLKGAVLIDRFYPAPGLRPMADLDLLARSADMERVGRVFERLGYRAGRSTPRHREFMRGEVKVVSYTGEHPGNPRGVELHDAVTEQLGPLRIDLTARLWAGALRGRIAGAPALIPSTRDLLAHLLIHTSHNLYFRRVRLIQCYDLLLTAAHLTPADWVALAEQMRSETAGRLLAAPLLLTERIFGPILPDDVRSQVNAALPDRLRQDLRTSPFSSYSILDPSEIALRQRLTWYRPGLEWLAFALQKIVPDRRELQQRYPALMGRPLPAYARYYGSLLVLGTRRLTGRARAVARRARL